MYIKLTQWFCLVLFTPQLLSAEPIRYNLLADPGNPQLVQASANTADIGIFSLQQPRTIPFSNPVKPPKIQCLTESGSYVAEYGKAIECKKITWSLHFDRLGGAGADVSEQRNLYSPTGWWVLFEWGWIPRLKDHHEVEICAELVNAKSSQKCRALPSLNSAPLIMPWGNTSTTKTVSTTQFTVYADNNKNVLNERSWEQLMSQYNYLQQLLSVKTPTNKDIDIIWVGIDADLGTLGGAAGSQAYISNYLLNNKQAEQNSLSRLHWISGHEVFHLLSTYSYPLWASESLAHYYGYKSLGKAGASFDQTPIEIWESRRPEITHASTGLYEANKIVTTNNDLSYYGLFYHKGAAFWQQLDNELNRRGASLDTYIELLSETDASVTQLNNSFVKAVEGVTGKKYFSELTKKYLL